MRSWVNSSCIDLSEVPIARRVRARSRRVTGLVSSTWRSRDDSLAVSGDTSALEGAGGADFGSSTLGKALAYIVAAENNPELKKSPEYKIAVAIARQDKTSVIQTETGAQTVTIPGIDVDSIFQKTAPEGTIVEDGITYTFTGKYKDNKPIYRNPQGVEGVME